MEDLGGGKSPSYRQLEMDKNQKIEEIELQTGMVLYRPVAHRHRVLAAVAGFYGDKRNKRARKPTLAKTPASKKRA